MFLLKSFKTFSDTSSLLRSIHAGSEATNREESNCKDGRGNTTSTPQYPVRNVPDGHRSTHIAVDQGERNQQSLSRCPMSSGFYKSAQEEMELIKSSHRTLTTTGCSTTFCQQGRATKIDEDRIGRDRPLGEIKTEAKQFLQECRDIDIIESDKLLDQRIRDAWSQIEATSKEGAGGIWEQTPYELEYGLRAAWKNSKRCIMRSEASKLILCDLRHVTSSRDMAHELIDNLTKAYNGGRVQPTAFVFPPRAAKSRGPMFWNEQILAFAGYKQPDGSVLGDTKSVELTDAMIELGWHPPSPRSRWDLLPLVVMADGDKPYLIELPSNLRTTVRIRHPRFQQEFEQLDLRWVLCPALSRLGFDIGGVQYTAAPFVGWFMDAEIGVRNLADTFRYNVLPDIVDALKLSDRPDTPFDDLPEYLRLAALSRAQAELNLAVYYSYEQEKVMMIDTMSASLSFMQFDDNHKIETGYRLPSDPYWLAPPQGSIVPLWHRGGAPNYQPKPLIARHVQDPVKAWRRECPSYITKSVHGRSSAIRNTTARRKVSIYVCSDGITAGKLGRRLCDRLNANKHTFREPYEIPTPQPLNSLTITSHSHHDIILIIASTTGCGELPHNARKFITKHTDLPKLAGLPIFSIYGNGDRTHGDTYNEAPKAIDKFLSNLGSLNFMDCIFDGDTATHNPDWDTFNQWAQSIEQFLSGQKITSDPKAVNLLNRTSRNPDEMRTATLLNKRRLDDGSLTLAKFHIGDVSYNETDHLKLITPNPRTAVAIALQVLGLKHDTILKFRDIDAATFLEWDVDLSLGFKTLDWYESVRTPTSNKKVDLIEESALIVLTTLKTIPSADLVEQILLDLHSIQPRQFSAASSMAVQGDSESKGTKLDIVVKFNQGGRFSDLWLSDAQIGQDIRFCLARSDTQNLAHLQDSTVPLVVIATGSGIGPVRSILQRRVMHSRKMNNIIFEKKVMTEISTTYIGYSDNESLDLDQQDDTTSIPTSAPSWLCGNRNKSKPSPRSPSHVSTNEASQSPKTPSATISLFAGFKKQDLLMIEEIVKPARDSSLFDCLELCPSNPSKRRIQDHLTRPTVRAKLERKLRRPGCVVYICANPAAAEAAVENLSSIAGVDVRRLLGDRLIEEVFRR